MGSLYLGANKVGSLYLGTAKVKELYKGGTKIFSSGGGSETDTQVKVGDNWYNKVTIGSQIWTAENLKENLPNSVWLRNDQTTSEARGYGKLYNFYSILKDDGTLSDALSAIIPEGWTVPTLEDFIALYTFAGSTMKPLRSTLYWLNKKGTNELGFNDVPAGYLSVSTIYSDTIYSRFHTKGTVVKNFYSICDDYNYYTEVGDKNTLKTSVRLIKKV